MQAQVRTGDDIQLQEFMRRSVSKSRENVDYEAEEKERRVDFDNTLKRGKLLCEKEQEQDCERKAKDFFLGYDRLLLDQKNLSHEKVTHILKEGLDDEVVLFAIKFLAENEMDYSFHVAKLVLGIYDNESTLWRENIVRPLARTRPKTAMELKDNVNKLLNLAVIYQDIYCVVKQKHLHAEECKETVGLVVDRIELFEKDERVAMTQTLLYQFIKRMVQEACGRKGDSELIDVLRQAPAVLQDIVLKVEDELGVMRSLGEKSVNAGEIEQEEVSQVQVAIGDANLVPNLARHISQPADSWCSLKLMCCCVASFGAGALIVYLGSLRHSNNLDVVCNAGNLLGGNYTLFNVTNQGLENLVKSYCNASLKAT